MAAESIRSCLASCLYATDGQIRKNAEQQLEQGVQFPGFSACLAQLSTRPELTSNDIGVRQLAAVLLKQVIKKHWSSECTNYEPPELSAPEREQIKADLTHGLADASSKIRTAVAMCVSAVAKADPNGWPGLMESLVTAIHSHRSSNSTLVHGAIRCLSFLSDDIDEQQLPQVSQALLPELLQVAGDGAVPPELRAACVSILNDLLRSLGVIAGVHQRQVRDLLVPLVRPWLPLLCASVAQPLSVQDTSAWSMRMLCLKALTHLVSYFSRALSDSMSDIMQAAWVSFTTSLQLYQACLVAGEGAEGEELPSEVDSEGDSLDLESLLSQLLELLMSLVGLTRYAKMVRPALPEMAYLVVGYMQMSARQVAEWSDNPAQYVADEEESTFTVRVSGELLIDALLQAFGLEAAGALMDAVERRMAEAAQAQAAGQAGWWKLREAALLALGCAIVEAYPGEMGMDGMGAGPGGGARQRAAAAALLLRAQRVVDEAVRVDLQGGTAVNPLLVGRVMWLAARLAPQLRPDQRPTLLAAAAAGLNSSLPMPVKIGACRALAALAPRVPGSVLHPLSEQLFGGVLGLLEALHEDALNLALESMVPLIKADPAAAARVLPALSTPVLQVWSRSVADPLVSQAALEVLEALARVPACLGPLAQQALPVVSGVVRQPQGQPDALVESCLDLLCKLVRPGHREVAAAVAAACAEPLLRLLLPASAGGAASPPDSGVAQGATELLVELLRMGREDFLAWCAAAAPPSALTASPDAAFHTLLAATHVLLGPAVDEYRSCLAGDLAHALVRCLPARAAAQPHLSGLLEGCSRKLVASNHSSLVGGLVAALSHMVVVGGPAAWLEALAAMKLQPPGAEQPVSGLGAVLPIMLERQSDVRGRPAAKMCCWALLQLLQTRHPLLMSFTVKGKRLDLSSGVRTRRQTAASGGEQWSHVPVAVRMTAVVAQLLVERPWDTAGGDEEAMDDVFGDDDEDWLEDGEDEEADEHEDDEAIEEDDVAQGAGGSGEQGGHLHLSLSGKGINRQEQASLDAHINRSPTLPADSAVVAGFGSEHGGPNDAGGGGREDPFLAGVDLAASIVAALQQLQSQPELAAFLAAALELLTDRRRQQVLATLAAP